MRPWPSTLRARLAVVLALAGLVALVLLRSRPGAERPDVHRKALALDRAMLSAFLADTSGLLPRGGLVVAVRGELFADVLDDVLPWEGVYGGSLALRLDRVAVRFDRGAARIELLGRAGHPSRATLGVPVAVVGALGVEGLGDGGETLVTRPEILGLRFAGLELERVPPGLLGAADRLGGEIGRELEAVLGGLEIPLRLVPVVSIPAVEDEDISIPGVRVPVGLAVRRVLAFDGRLWIAVDGGPGGVGATDSPRAPGHSASPRSNPGSALEVEVEALTEAVGTRFAGDPAAGAVRADSGHVVLRADTEFVTTLIRRATGAWLDSVRLHIHDEIDVGGDEGRVSADLGLFDAPVGSWSIQATILEVEATLLADSAVVTVADTNRLALRIPVGVRDASGDARIRFAWDAAAVPGLLCGDFELDEVFSGFVEPDTYELVGFFEFSVRGHGVVADPRQTEVLRVSPTPEPEAWARVREVLEERDGILSCGLGLDPDALLERLGGLLAEGFEFRLPEALLQPIEMPVEIRRRIRVGEVERGLEVHPLSFGLTADALQYSVLVRSVAPEELEPGRDP